MQFSPPNLAKVQATADLVLSSGAMSSPWWLPVVSAVTQWAGMIAAVGGVLVLAGRLWLLWQEIKAKRATGKAPD